MKSIITGDIIRSQSAETPAIWLNPLKKLFKSFGDTPEVWEIYRGDSFQIEIEPFDSLRVSFLIKSVIKKIREESLDVRLAIGIGVKEFDSDRVGESSGEAFLFSGRLLDHLKEQKMSMGIKSGWEQFDKDLNMMLKLALVIMDSWTNNSAEVAEIIIQEPEITQTEIAKRLGIVQSSVNERIKRASIHEIIKLEQYFRERLKSQY
ncbi:MAG: SatD family protein [Balneolaceae bacterium]